MNVIGLCHIKAWGGFEIFCLFVRKTPGITNVIGGGGNMYFLGQILPNMEISLPGRMHVSQQGIARVSDRETSGCRDTSPFAHGRMN